MIRSWRMGGRSRNSTPSQVGGGRKRIAPKTAGQIAGLLAERWPTAHVELDHDSPYQLLVATILAAQSTDKMINTITPALFARFPNPQALAEADPGDLEQMIVKSGFFRMKAKHLIGMARAVVERHGGEIPRTMDALCALPGVARKTANVVLGNAFGVPAGIVVDTHVTRLSGRLRLSLATDPVKIESDLMELLPREQWTPFANRLIWHGRYVCQAKKPDCEHCSLAPMCPSAFAPVPGATPSARSRWNANRRRSERATSVAQIEPRGTHPSQR